MRLRAVFLVLALAGCQMALPGLGGGKVAQVPAGGIAGGISGPAVTETVLAAPEAAPPETATPETVPPETATPETATPEAEAAEAPAVAEPVTEVIPAEVTPAEETPAKETPAEETTPETVTPKPPPAPVSAAEAACVKRGGAYVKAGDSGAMACVKRTRDSGKSCRRDRDCQGACLARSRTCSPITPLFGCHDVLQDDGRQVTLCLD